MNKVIEKIKSYLPYFAGLAVIACIIFYPELQGKKLAASDAVTWHAASKEYIDYSKKGESILWTNRIFSGMPLFTIAADISGNLFSKYFGKLMGILPNNIANLFLVFSCCFISLLLLRVSKNFAFVLAIAFGLNSWVLDSLWASHPTKILSYAFMLPVFAGFIAFMKYDKKSGLLAILLGICLSIAYGHYQIVYYGALVNVILAIYFFVNAIKEKTLPSFIKKSAFVLGVVGIGVLTNVSSLLIVNDYNKETMRGGKSELVKADAKSTGKDGGLDINYAFSWSYGFPELFNFMVPDAAGGSSNYKMKASKSKLAQAQNSTEDEITLPFYWGAQPFTGAPNYLGAVIVFLFIFSAFYWKNKIKYLFLGLFFLSMFMGLGKSFLGFNEILFNYLPMYNKFRTPTMSYSILNGISILMIGMAMRSFFKTEDSKEELIKSLKYTVYTIAGLFVVGFVMVSNEGYTSLGDAQTFKDNKPALDLMMEDRASFFKSDIFRSLVLMAIAAAAIFYYIKEKFSKKNLILFFGILIFLDLWTIQKRYLSSNVFEKVENTADLIPNEAYNQYLEQDKSHFRLFNTTNNTFNENTDGYRYSNVGGYSPAKLYRYQDLIDVHLGKGNMPVLSMLNTKYFIVQGQDGQKAPQQNPDACGNAWFVKEVKFAKNANEEMDSIGTFNPKNTAWVDQRFKTETNFNTNTDPAATISLSKYHPDNMEYISSSTTGGFVVFSEIWYKGNEDWNLFVNGKPQKLVRTNYLLRGAYIPAGNNTKIEMKFTAQKVKNFMLISQIASAILILIILWFLYTSFFKKQELNEEGKED
jgi:hypothetical protein